MARTEREMWETTGDAQVIVNHYSARGEKEGKCYGGRPGMRVLVTTDEREEINEELATTAATDVFRNGYLRPIRNVPDEIMERFESETKRGQQNEAGDAPGVIGGLSVEELVNALAEKEGSEFRAWVFKLNEQTLRRLDEIAADADAKASQLAAIAEALAPYLVTGPEGTAARLTSADRIVHQEPRTPGEQPPAAATG